MKYCVNYWSNFRYPNTVDEIIFSYSMDGTRLPKDLKEGKWREDQRIIIENIPATEEALKIVKVCYQEHKNLAVLIDFIDSPVVEMVKNAGIPFFFRIYARTGDAVYGLIQLGVSDVYIAESAGFDIISIGSYCKEQGVNVRVIPNIAQYAPRFKKEIPDPFKFFIRPEDTSTYEPYVDVFELVTDRERVSVVYEIYKNKKWLGDLNKLISGFESNLPNPSVAPLFGDTRLSCRQKCMQGKCNLCRQMFELAQRFADNKLVFETQKDKEWAYEEYNLQPDIDEETVQSTREETKPDPRKILAE